MLAVHSCKGSFTKKSCVRCLRHVRVGCALSVSGLNSETLSVSSWTCGGTSNIFEIFSTKEKGGHLVASRVRWDGCQRQRVTQAQDKRSQRSVQDENDKGDHCWTEACEGMARRMLKCLEDSEAAKVSTRELEEQVLSPNESRINIVSRSEKSNKLFQIFSQGENEVLVASKGR